MKFKITIDMIVDDEHVVLHDNKNLSPQELADIIRTNLEEDIEMYTDEIDDAQYLLGTIENNEKIDITVIPIENDLDLDLDFDFEEEE